MRYLIIIGLCILLVGCIEELPEEINESCTPEEKRLGCDVPPVIVNMTGEPQNYTLMWVNNTNETI